MRIDTMNGSSYQQAQTSQSTQAKPSVEVSQVKPSGMESKLTEKPKADQETMTHTEAVHAEVQAGELTTDEKQQENESKVISAIEKANAHIRTYDRRLEFSIHDTTKQIMVKVINTEDDSIIREIPSEKVLDMVAHMWEVAGILVDEKI